MTNPFSGTLGTMQRELFSTLCTDELGQALWNNPSSSKALMDTKTPQKAIAMIRSVYLGVGRVIL
jgi:hypothetical protein